MFGLKHFHSGIRGGNSDYAFVGRQKTTHVMFFNKHDIYCSFLYNDMKVHVLAPPHVEYYLKNNEAFLELEILLERKKGIILQKLNTNISRTISALACQLFKSGEWQVGAINLNEKTEGGFSIKLVFQINKVVFVRFTKRCKCTKIISGVKIIMRT